MTDFYRKLYSDDTASAALALSSLFLAVAQTAVVFEVMRRLHPAWWPALWCVAAVGYELATFATGLVIAVRGWSTTLLVGLVVFAVVSSWLGFDAAMRSQIGSILMHGDYNLAMLHQADRILWIRAILTGAALPLQYLLAVASGRQLGLQKVTQEETPQGTSKGTAENDKTGPDSAATSGDTAPSKVPREGTLDGTPDGPLAAMVRAAGGRMAVADAVKETGKNKSTVYRWAEKQGVTLVDGMLEVS